MKSKSSCDMKEMSSNRTKQNIKSVGFKSSGETVTKFSLAKRGFKK